MKSRIKLIIVDLYGVMTTGSYRDTCLWIAKKYKLPFEKVHDIVYHKHFAMASVGKITEPQSFAGASKELGLGMTWKELRAKHLSFQKLNKPVLKLALSLQKKGYRVVLLSKNTPSQFAETVKKMKLKRHFSDIINTHKFGLPKGDMRVVKIVLKKFKEKPEEVIQIDDQDFNLTALKTLGGKVVLYKNFGQMKKEIEKWTAQAAKSEHVSLRSARGGEAISIARDYHALSGS